MLRNKTIDIIKATVPALETHGIEITTLFYRSLFEHHPELLNVFNIANQKKGRQQTALANAVLAAAKHIDQLEAILPEVKLIANKHRSLGVQPEHYPIVGEHLLAAIKDVLGDAATDEILQAWAEAYGVIASAFIGLEQDLYREAEAQKGGWRGFRRFVVKRKVPESAVITSFYLVPEDGKALADHQPGQYISVKAHAPGQEYQQIRQYSLSDAPGNDYYRISVKRESPAGENEAGDISHYLHQAVDEGATLEISAPAGEFTLSLTSDRPVVLISGGVGQTPLISMLNTLMNKQPQRAITWIHGAINSERHAFRKHVAELAATHDNLKVIVVYSHPTDADRAARHFDREGHIDAQWLAAIMPGNEADVYFCGPIPFMKTVNRALQQRGVPRERIHFEFFGPAGELENDDDPTVLQKV